jgi:hypothetical protein
MTDRRTDVHPAKHVPDDQQFREHHGEPMSDEQVARAGEPNKSKGKQTGDKDSNATDKAA